MASPPPSPPPSARQRIHPIFRAALLMGNSDYCLNDKLPACINDVELMQKCLTKIGINNPVDEFRFIMIANNHTAEQMARDVSTFLSRVLLEPGHENCMIMIFYSGHGATIQETHYLVPVDDHKPLYNKWVNLSSLCTLIKKRLPDCFVLFVLDCCRNEVKLSILEKIIHKLDTQNWSRHYSTQKGYFFVFGCSPDEYSIASADYSVLTKMICKALLLSSAVDKGHVENFVDVSHWVSSSTNSRQTPYTLGMNTPSFVFVSSNKVGVVNNTHAQPSAAATAASAFENYKSTWSPSLNHSASPVHETNTQRLEREGLELLEQGMSESPIMQPGKDKVIRL